MITTIQLHEKVKRSLDRLKETGKESYEEVIVKIMQAVEKQKREKKALLKEGYREMAQESMAVTKEWSSTDKDWD